MLKTLTDEVLKEGQNYINLTFGTDLHLTEEVIHKMVNDLYPGGWEGFNRVWQDRLRPTNDARLEAAKKTGDLTQQQKLRAVIDATGYAVRVGALDEVYTVKISDLKVVLSLRYYRRVRMGEYRWTVRESGMKMVVWTRKHVTDMFTIDKKQCLDFEDTDFVPFEWAGQYSVLNDDQRWDDKADQWHLCYRPGTSRSPMDGPYGEGRQGWNECYDKYERKMWDAAL